MQGIAQRTMPRCLSIWLGINSALIGCLAALYLLYRFYKLATREVLNKVVSLRISLSGTLHFYL